MSRVIVAALVMLALAGCATRTVVETVTVKVPVAVMCLKEAPGKPVYGTGKGVYPGDKEAAAILASDFEKAEQYGRAWEAAAAGCHD